MTALTSADVTVTVTDATRGIGARNVRRHIVTIAFGDGTKTYPTNGVPLPTYDKFGFARKYCRSMDIVDTGASPAMISWDSTHNTLRMVHPTQQTSSTGNRDGVEYSTSDAPAATTLVAEVEGF